MGEEQINELLEKFNKKMAEWFDEDGNDRRQEPDPLEKFRMSPEEYDRYMAK